MRSLIYIHQLNVVISALMVNSLEKKASPPNKKIKNKKNEEDNCYHSKIVRRN